VIVLDTSFLYALLDGSDDLHNAAVTWYRDCDEDLTTSPLVLAEVDQLAGARAGAAAQRAFRTDLVAGAYAVEWWDGAAAEAATVASRYESFDLGLTDASLVVLARRVRTTRIATFDERHFRAVTPLDSGRAFAVLPADA
jgi:predicted nucleic acid-binding protein